MSFSAKFFGEPRLIHRLGGGYKDSIGTPSDELAAEIQFVDTAIGDMVNELKTKHLFQSTAIIITAKHGQSPINPKRVLRIPADDATKNPPSSYVATDQARRGRRGLVVVDGSQPERCGERPRDA